MGCFWCSEDIFGRVKGVKSTAVGYIGGKVERPTYEQVCTDRTGHAEVVQVEYDPEQAGLGRRRAVQVGRVLPQPRAKVRCRSDKAKAADSGAFKRKIVTEVSPASAFWQAEEYHKKYYQKCGLKMH
jgi:peptide-methionine (S)-S-oxide reductase